ncbi:MAG: selenide, water dikinase SelD [Caulobacter sp.]|nr:selenide, water dikinase SelD [Caulobacter sp.]
MRPSAPITRDLLLIGGGHAHAVLLRMWGMRPLPGVRLTLVNPDPTAPYTGMLPGFVAGHYQRDDLDIDLVRLARFAGARLVLDRVTGLDLKTRRATLAGRPDIAFDIASIDIGITSGLTLPSGEDARVWPAKPLGAFADAWVDFVEAVCAGARPPSAAVIGGGVGGVELAMAMAWRLRAAASDPAAVAVALVEANPALLPHSPPSLRRALSRNLEQQGVRVMTGSPVVGVGEAGARLAGGDSVSAAFVAAAAGASPAPWLAETGLALKDGFVRVDAELRSLSHPAVFAVGDAAHMEASPRPKAGVYAVRQGPALYENLRAALSGAPLRPFRPQRDHLKLISLGGRAAVAEKWGVTLGWPGLWVWKNRIDRRFMDRLNSLPAMAAPPPTPGPVALEVTTLEDAQPLCGGCGSKVGPATLDAALANLPAPRRPDVLQGRGDDAAVLAWGEAGRQVLTTDHFRAFTLDPYVLGQITANHALGDIWAMGADPQAALATLILPAMSPAKQADTAHEILAALETALAAAGADLVGGHTSLGAELTVGLTVTGLLNGRPAIGLDGARAGDRLILTRPVGVGTVLAAEMRGLARGRWVAAAFDQMRQSSGPASQVLRDVAHAMTDVTGFGLAGHLQAMLEKSDLAGSLSLSAIPWADGAIDLATGGVHSSLYPETSKLAERMTASEAVRADPRFALLFDPQTAGGLLAAVAADEAAATVDRLHGAGQTAWIIGELAAASPDNPRLTVSG